MCYKLKINVIVNLLKFDTNSSKRDQFREMQFV